MTCLGSVLPCISAQKSSPFYFRLDGERRNFWVLCHCRKVAESIFLRLRGPNATKESEMKRKRSRIRSFDFLHIASLKALRSLDCFSIFQCFFVSLSPSLSSAFSCFIRPVRLLLCRESCFKVIALFFAPIQRVVLWRMPAFFSLYSART